MPIKTRKKRRLGKRNRRGGAVPPPRPTPRRKKFLRRVIEEAESEDDDDSDEETTFDLMMRAQHEAEERYRKHEREDKRYKRNVVDPLENMIAKLEKEEKQAKDNELMYENYGKWINLQKKLSETHELWKHAKNWMTERERSRHPSPTRHPSPDEYSPAEKLTKKQLDEIVKEVKANVRRRGPDYLRSDEQDGRPMILDNPSLLIPDNMGTGSSTRKHPTRKHPTRKHPTRKHPTRKHPTRKHHTRKHHTRKHPTRKHPTRKHPTRKHHTRKHHTRKHRKRPHRLVIRCRTTRKRPWKILTL